MDYRWLIARRYLASRRNISLISIITGLSTVGVTLGVAALIVVLSVMNGFYDFVQDLLVSIDPHVRIVSAEDEGLTDVDSLMRVVLDEPHVESASPYVEGRALLSYETGFESGQVVVVRGIDPETASGVSRVVEETGMGEFDLARRDGIPGMIAGGTLAQRVGLLPPNDERAGSQVELLSAPAIERSFTQLFSGSPVQRFEVRGLYEMQAAYDENHVFVDLREAQRLFRMSGRVTGVELRLEDLDRASAVQRSLRQQLADDQFEIQTWYDLQGALYDVMRLEKWGATAILMLIVIVAAFNIVGSLTMVVIEKRRDVGVLQAMGVSRKNIRRIFITEGFLIGLVGTGGGLVLGLGLSWLQMRYELVPLAGAESFMIDAYPVSIRLLDIIFITGVSMALCMLASIYPAHRASSIEPAHAIQQE